MTGPQGLLIGGSSVGFRLTNSAPEGTPTKVLKWVVLERLIRLTDNGQKLHPSGLKRIDLKQLPAGKHRGLTFPLPTSPAVYSVEVTIQNHRGRLLGRYGEYVRVVERNSRSRAQPADLRQRRPRARRSKLLRKQRHRVDDAGRAPRSNASTGRPGSRSTRPQYSPAQTRRSADPRARRKRTARHRDPAPRPAGPLQTDRDRRHRPRRTGHRRRRIRRALRRRPDAPTARRGTGRSRRPAPKARTDGRRGGESAEPCTFRARLDRSLGRWHARGGRTAASPASGAARRRPARGSRSRRRLRRPRLSRRRRASRCSVRRRGRCRCRRSRSRGSA